jgi:hypothetical protein
VADFSQELILAARAYIGKESVYHWGFAGNCLEAPSEDCFSSGIGPDVFDCSGLIIRSICDVQGVEPFKRSNGTRHVRDMWQAAESGNQFVRTTELEIGSLLVTHRSHMIHGKPVSLPGHIGVISELGVAPKIIHASAAVGEVEERALKTQHTVLGTLAVLF